jgi:hypothetical protein
LRRLFAPEGRQDLAQGSAQGFNLELRPHIGETADIAYGTNRYRLSAYAMLLYAVARRAGSAEMVPA